ncbi:MAG TPA: hypothetical protein VF501_03075, partial [Thiobacillus sp.]
MLRTFLLLLALMPGFNAGQALAADTPPDVLARTTTQDVLAILKQDKEIRGGLFTGYMTSRETASAVGERRSN